MYGIRSKRMKRICKWIASLLTIILLINESGISALAAEIREVDGCICDVLCSADSVNEACPVCAENYEKCNVTKVDEISEPAETQEQQEGDVPETTVQEPVVTEPEIPVSQESGAGFENMGAGEEISETELNNESYVYETTPGLEPGTEGGMSDVVENGSESLSAAENVFADSGNVVVSRTADVVFVIDATGSMGSYIERVKNRISEFVELLDERVVDVRVRFVVYYDCAIGENTVLSSWYTGEQIEEAKAYLQNLQASGGGDGPETALDGMGQMFQDDFGWRENVNKFSILLTDAPYKTDNTFGYTFNDITNELLENDIASSLIVPGDSVYDNWMTNGGEKGYIYGDYRFLLDWIDDVILPNVEKRFQNVNIEVKKDTFLWEEHGKDFILKSIDKGFYVKKLNAVKNGIYRPYEVTASGGYLDAGVTITVADEDVTATVDYYTVTFYDEEGEVYDPTSEQAPQIVLKGQMASRPNPPTKTGYTCKWVTEKDGTTAFNFLQGINSTTNIYASWVINTYSVNIKVQKDDEEWNEHNKIFYLKKKNTDIPIDDLTAAGAGSYMLLENEDVDTWITDLAAVEYGIYDIYDATDSSDIVNTGVTVTVNGIDTPVVDYYTVTFYDYDDVSVFAEQIVLKNATAVEPSVTPTKDGYAFSGWSVPATDGTEFDFETPITEKTELYAKWFTKVTINVKKDNSDWNDSRKEFALLADDEESPLVDLNRVSKGTYKIQEIKRTADSIDYVDTGVPVTVNGNDTDVAATVDYYTVTFYDENGIAYDPTSEQASQIVLKGQMVSSPNPPTNEGYNFNGWGSDDTDDETDFNFATPITKPTKLYAKWTKEVTFTISATAGAGGKVVPSGAITVKSGASQTFDITPNDGYQIDTVLVDNNTVTLENAQFSYRTLSGSVGTEINATEPESAVLENDTAAVNPLNDDSNTKAKQYVFENVTSDHTLSVTFKAIPTKKSTKKSSSSNNGGSSDTPVIIPIVKNDTPVIPEPDIVPDVPTPAPNDSEPKTGDASHVEVYATIGMIAGLSYLLLYFSDGESGMTEEEKEEIVGALVRWARKGKRFRKCVALAIVFVILVYYHSIGKRTTEEWKELYE